MVVSSVPPMISAIWSGRSLCSTLTMSAPSSIVMCGCVSSTSLMCRKNVSVSSPFTANVAIPLCSHSAAATSSWVDSGFDAQSATSAPPAASVSIRFAVSVVTWRHAPIRTPASGRSFSNRSRISARTGISPAAHSMRSRPFGASARSLTSHPMLKLLRRSVASRSTNSLPTAFAVSFETAKAVGRLLVDLLPRIDEGA